LATANSKEASQAGEQKQKAANKSNQPQDCPETSLFTCNSISETR